MVSAIERLEKIEVASAYQLVAEAIEREIVAGRMRPGEGVGTEAAHHAVFRARLETRPRARNVNAVLHADALLRCDGKH